jgi:uncharacterized protein with von Willebrand factor type A (vWA) domain
VFVDFLFALRRRGLKVGGQELLALNEAASKGLIESLDELYRVGRAVFVKDEGLYDDYDLAFAETWQGVEAPLEIKDALLRWLEDPRPRSMPSLEELAKLTGMDLDELRRAFEEMLAKQEERHDGGNRYIGTGGTSPFGAGGRHPTGVRVGPGGGGRSAVQVAWDRRFRNYRHDAVLDVRNLKVALRRLRSMTREGEVELDIDETIGKTCRNGGDIELVFNRSRVNRFRLLLLMDAGGSMDPHSLRVDRLFTAVHQSNHFRSFHHYFFHNVPYSRLYTDIHRREAISSLDVIRRLPEDTRVVFVGDACMAPYELAVMGGAIDYWNTQRVTGWDWLQRFRRKFSNVAWLNPDAEAYWRHPTVEAIASLFPMFPLTLDGLRDAVQSLRKMAA